MTQVITNPDEVTGWRGEIRDSEVVSDGEGRDREDGQPQRRGEDETSPGQGRRDEDYYEDRDYDQDRDYEERAGEHYDEDEDRDYKDENDEDEGRNYDEDQDREDRDYDEEYEDREAQGAKRGDGKSSRARKPVKAGSRDG